MPLTHLVAAVSSDGFIARKDGNQSELTCPEDFQHLRSCMNQADTQVLGRITYEMYQRPLREFNRRCLILTRSVSDLQEIHPGHYYWNPLSIPYQDACATINAKKLCLLGGADTYTYFMQHNLIQDISLTVAHEAILIDGIPLLRDRPGPKLWSYVKAGEFQEAASFDLGNERFRGTVRQFVRTGKEN